LVLIIKDYVGTNLEMMHDGIINNKESDEKEYPPGKESEGNVKASILLE